MRFLGIFLTWWGPFVVWWWFFSTFAAMRLVRFGIAASLAHVYGRGILRVLESDTFQTVAVGFVAVAILGTVASAVLLWRNTQGRRLSAA